VIVGGNPADLLADIRSQIRNLEEGERPPLRDYLLDHEADRVGDQYVAQVGTWSQKRIDTRGLIREVGTAIVERFTTRLKVPTIRLKLRETAKV
jgi:hypothetical protein